MAIIGISIWTMPMSTRPVHVPTIINMPRLGMLPFLLLTLLSAKLVDSCFPCPGRDAWRFVPLAFAATGSETRGPHLAVVIMRPGVDPRPLAALGQTLTISVAVNNLLGDSDAHSSVLTV